MVLSTGGRLPQRGLGGPTSAAGSRSLVHRLVQRPQAAHDEPRQGYDPVSCVPLLSAWVWRGGIFSSPPLFLHFRV